MIEVRSNHMPDGGLVTTFTDITPSVKAAEALERANATLERRVRERTSELTRLNTELERAKAEADEANVSKTRFVAAASHDILQPLNAARLYVTSLIERQRAGEDGDLVPNIDASLEAVEEIFAALLDISRLDTGAMKPEFAEFRIDELLHRLDVEFAPLAREKGLDCASCLARSPCVRTAACCGGFYKTSFPTRSNIRRGQRAGRLPAPRRQAAHRSLRYRHRHSHAKRRAVFKEFHRLDQGARVARGVGLGLSIVERIARVLDCEVALKSMSGAARAFRSKCRARRPRGARPAADANRCRPARRHGRAVHRQRPQHSRRHGDTARRLGLPHADRRRPRRGTGAMDASGIEPDGLLVDYHLDGGNGIAAIAELRRRLGRQLHLPAILITADRSLHVREEARAEGAHSCNKPLKPASLRALITQWRVQRVAAE